MRTAIFLGNSGNLSGGQKFFALDTEHTITRHEWVVLPMPPTVIARVNLFGKNEPFILFFTNRCEPSRWLDLAGVLDVPCCDHKDRKQP